jgi:hypothetical protein
VSLADELAAAGGVQAPPQATARLRDLLAEALRHGAAELGRKRSGTREDPVVVALAADGERLLAAIPVSAALHADIDALSDRGWLLVAAVIGALVDLTAPPALTTPEGLAVRVGESGGHALLGYPARGLDPAELEEIGPLAFDEHAGGIDRLRARAVAAPARLLAGPELKEPIGAHHPLRIAEAIARLGGHPEDPRSVEEHEDAVLALLAPDGAHAVRPHEDPDPGRRIARRILQRLDGMGKWGGYHTDFAHLARGFAGNERALAQRVGEALLESGLLAEKPSVGQRHVFLNPRRAAEIRKLIDAGELPPGMRLPSA